MQEIVVSGQEGQVMTYAKLSQQGVDRADLNPGSTTSVAQLGSIDMILPIWSDERQSGKPLDDVRTRVRAGKTLKQFLENEPGSHDDLFTCERIAQFLDLRGHDFLIAPESEEPDTGVYQQGHRRDRSAL